MVGMRAPRIRTRHLRKPRKTQLLRHPPVAAEVVVHHAPQCVPLPVQRWELVVLCPQECPRVPSIPVFRERQTTFVRVREAARACKAERPPSSVLPNLFVGGHGHHRKVAERFGRIQQRRAAVRLENLRATATRNTFASGRGSREPPKRVGASRQPVVRRTTAVGPRRSPL